MNRIKKGVMIICASVTLLGISVGASAQEVVQEVIRISSWLPPGHHMNSVIWPNWIKAIEEATDGRVTGKIEYGLAPPQRQLDLVEDGGADVGWIFHGYVPGRFKATQIIEVPGLIGDAEAASVAYWRAHQEFLAKANEHEGVRLIGLMTHGPAQMFMANPARSIFDLEGSKIRVGGAVSITVSEYLGLTPVQLPATQAYEALRGKVTDGIMIPMATYRLLRLNEVAPFALTVPGGLYRGSLAIFMNEDTLSRLSERDRKAVESTLGEPLSAMAGRAWAEADQNAIDQAEELGIKFIPLPSNEMDELAELSRSVREKILEEVASTGVDAEAALAFIEEQMRTYVRAQ